MSKKVYIFSDAISRKNGGSSSVLDLANGLVDLGCSVTFFSFFGYVDRYIYNPTDINFNINFKVIPFSYCDMTKYHWIRKSLSRLFYLLPSKDFNLNNSVVIDAVGLSSHGLEKLKTAGAQVIYNHAGSPNAMIKYFGMNGAKRNDLEIEKEKYLKMINSYNYILFQSPTQASDLKKMAGWEKDKTLVLRPSVSTKDISNISESKNLFDESDFNVVIVGSVQERKGQHLLPRISHAISSERGNVVFHVVGNIVNETYKNKIVEETINLKQSEKIIFHGFKSNYLEYIKEADIVLQLSEEEGVSRILREAMALEKVILSFRLDGTNDLLVDKEDCLLSDYGDIESIINNILKIYGDKDLSIRLSMRAKENFDSKYSKKEYLKNLNTLISKIEA